MEPSDGVLLALFASVLLAPIVGSAIAWRTMARYREKGALAHDTFTPGRPCRLELPPSGPLELMLRFATTKDRGTQESLTAVVEVKRGAQSAHQFAVGLSITARGPEGMPFQPNDGASYAASKMGRTTTRTKVLARLPAGEAGYVTVDLLTNGADVGYCAAFVKPAK